MKFPKKEIEKALSYIMKHKQIYGLNVLIILSVSTSEVFGIGTIIPLLQSLVGNNASDFFLL